MTNEPTRRELLARLACLSAAGPALLAVSACDSKPAPTVALEFDDSNEFYAAAAKALNQRQSVHVTFSGKAKITDKSVLLTWLRKAENAADVRQSLKELDNADGRDALRLAFAPELLEHQVVSKELATQCNNVVEPGTVALVVLITLIIVGSAAATTQIVLHGPVKAEFRATMKPLGASIRFEPA